MIESILIISHQWFSELSSLWEEFVAAWDKVSIDALFSAGIAIFVFTAGWIVSFLYEKRKESKRLRQRLRFLKGSLESTISAMRKQASNYKKLSIGLKDMKKRIFSLKTNSNLSLAFYSPQLIEDTHRFLEQYEPRSFDVVKILSGAVNGIENQLEISKVNHLSFSEKANKNEEEWVNATNEIFRFNGRLKTRIENSDEDPTFFIEFNDIILPWLETRDDIDIENTYVNLIEPLRDYCNDALPHQDARIVLPYLHQAKYSYENIVSNRELYSNLFEKHEEKLHAFITKIENTLEIFEENLKSFRWIRKYFNRSESKIHLLDDGRKSKETTSIKS